LPFLSQDETRSIEQWLANCDFLHRLERVCAVPCSADPEVDVEAGGSSEGATAAQEDEQARMTWDVLGRLLATCSSDRPVEPCDRAVLPLSHFVRTAA